MNPDSIHICCLFIWNGTRENVLAAVRVSLYQPGHSAWLGLCPVSSQNCCCVINEMVGCKSADRLSEISVWEVYNTQTQQFYKEIIFHEPSHPLNDKKYVNDRVTGGLSLFYLPPLLRLISFEMGAWDSIFKEVDKIDVDLSDFNVVKGANKKITINPFRFRFIEGSIYSQL